MLHPVLSRIRYAWNRRIRLGAKSRAAFTATLCTRYGGSITIGRRTKIHPYAMLQTYRGDITIGDSCTINPFCMLYGHGGLHIGNHVLIASHTVIVPSNHVFDDTCRPISQQGQTSKGIRIADDVWIGSGVRILDGVEIAEGCVIAAGSVLTKSTAPYEVWAGVPARCIKKR